MKRMLFFALDVSVDTLAERKSRFSATIRCARCRPESSEWVTAKEQRVQNEEQKHTNTPCRRGRFATIDPSHLQYLHRKTEKVRERGGAGETGEGGGSEGEGGEDRQTS